MVRQTNGIFQIVALADFFFTGTPATASQMAKDVVTFLNWAAEPEHDERKKIGLKAVILFSALTAVSLYVKRFKWTVIKNRKIRRWYLATHIVLLLIARLFQSTILQKLRTYLSVPYISIDCPILTGQLPNCELLL